jgi:hypothetical protein
MKKVLFLLISLFTVIVASSQSYNQDIDPKWDKYYNERPSGIRNNFQASDFIRIIELVNFVPQSRLFEKNQTLLKKVLLSLEQSALRQLMITGSYFSKTYKHDDYYMLYNMTYNRIGKETWDAYCPYLIPLMDVDKLINLH